MKRFTLLEFRFQKAVKAKSFGRESKLKWVHTALLVSALELSGSARLQCYFFHRVFNEDAISHTLKTKVVFKKAIYYS